MRFSEGAFMGVDSKSFSVSTPYCDSGIRFDESEEGKHHKNLHSVIQSQLIRIGHLTAELNALKKEKAEGANG